MSATFTIPKPPSANGLFANVPGKGRIKTRSYKAWIKEAGWVLRIARVKAATGRVRVRLEVETPKAPKADIDNIVKPVMDLLKTAGVIADDGHKHVAGVSADWVEGIVGCRVTITEAG